MGKGTKVLIDGTMHSSLLIDAMYLDFVDPLSEMSPLTFCQLQILQYIQLFDRPGPDLTDHHCQCLLNMNIIPDIILNISTGYLHFNNNLKRSGNEWSNAEINGLFETISRHRGLFVSGLIAILLRRKCRDSSSFLSLETNMKSVLKKIVHFTLKLK